METCKVISSKTGASNEEWGNKMNSKKTVFVSTAILALSLLVVVFAGYYMSKNKEDKHINQLKLYFIDSANSELVEEKREVDLESKEDLIRYAVEQLQKMPNTVGLKPAIPEALKINKIIIEDDNVKLDISSYYNEMSPQEQVLLRAALIKTLTELDFVYSVEFLIDGKPLAGYDGKAIGAITQEDILLDAKGNDVASTNVQTIKLYFADQNGEKLVLEEREIVVNPNVPLEKYVVEQLILGPERNDLEMTVPKETVIKDIKTKDGICYVDLSSDFQTKHWGGSAGETLTIYSIVNSLTELPNIKKVQFLIEGEKQATFKGHYDFSIPFERDESLIAD